MSTRSAEYRSLIDDVMAHSWLLEPEELIELRDMIARVEQKKLARQPAQAAQEPAE